jgi:hypothetical protein
MRKVFFTTAFFLISPIVFVFALILSVFLYYENSNNNSLIISRGIVAYAALPTTQNIFSVSIQQNDGRTEKVRQFLARYGSPLEPFAQDIIDAADAFELDYRLIPAIAMQESNLCRVIPDNSYNCWGFGIYGKTITRFKDYKDAIYTVTKTLATKYKSKGLVTPDQIMTMYTPSSNGSWAFSVNHFMKVLE